MQFLNATKDWFYQNAKKKNQAFWTLIVYNRGKPQANSTNNDIGDPDTSWKMLSDNLSNLVKFGNKRQFDVIFKTIPNDPSPKTLPIDLSGDGGGLGIAGLGGGLNGTGTNDLAIAALKEKHAAELAAKVADHRWELKFKELEQKVDKSDGEKVFSFLDRLLSKPNVTNMIEKAIDKNWQPVSGGNSAKQTDREERPAEAKDGTLDFNPAIESAMKQKQLAAADWGIDYNPAIEATLLIRETGNNEPAELLYQIANYIKQNPQEAMQLATRLGAKNETAQ